MFGGLLESNLIWLNLPLQRPSSKDSQRLVYFPSVLIILWPDI